MVAADVPQLDLFGEQSAQPLIWRHPNANRQCRLGDAWVAYEFKRGQRRTIGLSVGPQGLSVRAPRWASVSDVEAFIQTKSAWVQDKLRMVQEHQRAAAPPLRWHDGEAVPYLGRTLTLVLDPGLRSGVSGASVQGEVLQVGLARDAEEARIREVVQVWFRREAMALFTQRMQHFAAQMGVSYTHLSLSSAGTRWGSASASGRIRLNWRLMHLDMALIDYVVVHELAHLREMNHSPAFWAVVASVLPDHVERRQALKRVRLAAF